jgi:ribosomal protein L21E
MKEKFNIGDLVEISFDSRLNIPSYKDQGGLGMVIKIRKDSLIMVKWFIKCWTLEYCGYWSSQLEHIRDIKEND